jgi:membrane associated rhomboid family serine protease|uniref:Rhomboid family intramembrane serine protease n=1 Tax=Desulfobacca acetoxidans TaxID=60893 RepID=A0A7V6A2S3_9BACT
MIPVRGAPTKNGWPWVTLGLIAVNVLVFLYTLKIGPDAALALFWKGGAVPSKLSKVKLLTSLTSFWLMATVFISLFLHAGWAHLLGNMWFLWLFGEGLEDDLGHWRYLGFYLFAGFFACLFHVLAASSITAPLIGASGAIAGVMGAYLVRLPQSPIRTLSFLRLRLEILHIPAFVWLFLWLALQFYGLKQGGPVAWVAHLGGFAIGIFGVTLFVPVKPQLAKVAIGHNPQVRQTLKIRTTRQAPKKRRSPVKKK